MLKNHKKRKPMDRSVKKKFACTECDYSTSYSTNYRDFKCNFKRHCVTYTGVKRH